MGFTFVLSAMLAPAAGAQGAVPDAPTAVAVYSVRTGELEVRWSSTDSDSTTSFKIQWRSGGEEFDSSRQETSDPVTSIEEFQTASSSKRYVDTITGLTDGTEYTVRVLATNSNGDSEPSDEVTSTPQSTPGQTKEFIETEVIELFEDAYPWLRETWDYVIANNVEVVFDSGMGGYVRLECTEHPQRMNLRTCATPRVNLGREYDPIFHMVVHELAHVFTLATGVAEKPDPLAIAHLYFYDLLPPELLHVPHSRDILSTGCPPRELYADALSLITLGEGVRNGLNYWNVCKLITNKANDPGAIEAQTVVRSAAAGDMPSWLADTYNDSEGNLELERLWLKVKTFPPAVDPRDEVVIVHQLRKAFGGFCDNMRASDSVYEQGKTRNPWKDGGCQPGAPTSVSATTSGSSQVTVSWQEPLDDGGSPIEGYKIHWKHGTQSYTNSRMKVVTDLADLQVTITGVGADSSHTIRVLAYNHNGDGEGAEITVTPTGLDTSVPELLTARLDTFEPTVRLTYNEPLDESSTPSGSAFSVSVNGTAQTPSVSIEGNVVSLTITGSLSPSKVLTVTYTPPTGAGASPLKDSAGNQAMSFSGMTVRNDRTDVSFSSDPGPDNTYAWNSGQGSQDAIDVEVTFSEEVIAYGEPELSLKIGDETRRASYHSGSGTDSLIFRHLVEEGDHDDDGIEVARGQIDGLVRYASNKAVAPGGVVLAPNSNHLVDAVRAKLVSAGILAGQSELVLTWDRALDESALPHFTDKGFYLWDFTEKEELTYREERTIDDRRVTLTLTSVVPAGTRLLVSWRRPSNNPLKDTVGNWVKENIAFLEGAPLDARVVNSLNSPAQFPTTEDGQRSVDENTAAGQHLGAAIAALDNDGDQLTYAISGSDAEFFDVVSTSGQLRTKDPLDHEDRSTYSFTLSVTDNKDQFGFKDPAIDDTITVTVTVNDVDEPATISFSAASGATALDNVLTVDENHAGSVARFSANDPENKAGLTYTWSLTGSDAADFNLNQSGDLTFAASPDYESPADSGGNNVYDITVNALDSDGQTGSVTVSVTVSPVDEPPTISGDAAPRIEEEGAINVGTYQARDTENATIAWQPLGGADSARFDFTTLNGRLAFKSSPDYEEANDSGGDNTYHVTLSASAGGHTAHFSIIVSVVNKEEPGSLILSSLQPQAEADFTATLTDPDIVQSTSWTWERSTSSNGPWSAISGASNGTTNSIYRPDADDVGYHLGVTAVYTDGHGPNKSLAERSARAVIAQRLNNNPPAFDATTTTRGIAENSPANTSVGAPVTAIDPDRGDVLTYNLRDSSLFTIDRASGQIRVADGAALDHETATSHTVTVTASDSSNASDEIMVTINFTEVNEPPEADDDTVTTKEDELATFSVLSNDRDPENDALSVRMSRAPRHGSATVDPVTHEITYTPNANYNGSDTLTYTVQDQHGLTDEGSVALTITPVNDRPEFPPGPITREVARDSQSGENVGDPVAAKDADGDRLMYMLSGPGASSFVINENTGQITLRDEFGDGASSQSEYTVTVEVVDESFDQAEVIVKITVVEQVTPKAVVGGGGGGGGGGGPPPVPVPSDKDFDWNVTRDIESLDRENDLPTGLWSDGTVLWVVENSATGADRLFAYGVKTGERLTEHEFELDRRNRFSHGIWSDGEVVWIADSGQDKLFAYNLKTGERREERDIELSELNRDPHGIWSDGQMIYVIDSVEDSLFAYHLETGELLAEYPLDKLNQSPRGIWSDGVILWVSDDGAKRIFAYRPVDGELERIEDEEFTFRSLLKAGNGNPRGIWSDGDIMYVADEQDDKVYTYNIPDATIALLDSLSLTELDIGTFRPDLMEYAATAAPELATTTVIAAATQEKATVVIEPDDADGDLSNGHEVALGDETTIAVTVTSSDGSRSNRYEIAIRKPTCLSGLGDERLSEVRFTGGSLDELARCAQTHGVTVLLYWSGESWLLFAPGQPEFLSQVFRRHFESGVSAGTTLIAAMSKERARQN